MHQILNLSNDAYEEIFQEIDTNDLVEKKGIIYVWTNKNLKSRKLEIKVRNDLGIKQKLLSQNEVLELEPNLNPVFDAGVIYESAMHAKDPHGILKQIFKLFLKRGGKFIQTNVENLEQININETKIPIKICPIILNLPFNPSLLLFLILSPPTCSSYI